MLAAAFGLTGEAALRLRAAIDLGLNFEAWRVLVREEGLNDDQALDLVLRLCLAAAADTALTQAAGRQRDKDSGYSPVSSNGSANSSAA